MSRLFRLLVAACLVASASHLPAQQSGTAPQTKADGKNESKKRADKKGSDPKKAGKAEADPPNLVRILVIDGQPKTKFIADETTYLMAFFDIIREKDDVRHRYKVIKLVDVKLNQAAADLIDIVILCNVESVSETNVKFLDGIVKRGGAVMIFVGNKLDPVKYNTAFFRDGKGMLPGRLTDHVLVKDATPKFLKGRVADMKVAASGLPKFRRAYQVADVDEKTVETVAVLSDGKPLLLVKKYGKGRCLLYTSTIDLAWNQMAVNPLFVLTMLESIRYARGERSPAGVKQGTDR